MLHPSLQQWRQIARVCWEQQRAPFPEEALEECARAAFVTGNAEDGITTLENKFREARDNAAFWIYGAP